MAQKKASKTPGAAKAASAALAGIPVQAVPPPPPQGAPLPPTPQGKLPATEVRRLHHPMGVQISLAAQAAQEIRNSTTWAQDFGPHAPDQNALADALDSAHAWSDEAAAARAWDLYVHTTEELAWHYALVMKADLEPEFDTASRHDASIKQRYSATNALIHARQVAALAGAATKKANQKKAAPKAP
jgi:hypothetical protein